MAYDFDMIEYGSHEIIYENGERTGSNANVLSDLHLRLGISTEINIWRFFQHPELDNSGRRFIMDKEQIKTALEMIDKSELNDERKEYLHNFFLPGLDHDEVEIGVH